MCLYCCNMNMYNNYYLNQARNEELITFNEAIEKIRISIENEREDELFYDELINNAPTQKEKDIIISMRDDERKHNQILRGLYYRFTCQMVPQDEVCSSQEQETKCYKEQLEEALFGEIEAVSKYRKIMGAMPDADSYTLIMSIMTDEIRHADKYNFLIYNAK